MLIETVDIHEIHADPANANQHSEADIVGLMAKLATFEQVEPLVIQAKTRKVIGGNGRLEAMRRLGWTHCEANVIDVDNVTATALGIALNTRKSEFDETILAEQLRALQSEGWDTAKVGIDEAEVDAMIAALKAPEEGDWQDAIGGLPDGDKSPFQQMTFTVTDDQAGDIKRAMDAAKEAGPFIDTGNENSNGNALARLAEAYLGGG